MVDETNGMWMVMLDIKLHTKNAAQIRESLQTSDTCW